MNPLLLSALFSFAPGLFAGLFGNPQAKYRKQVQQLTSPQNIQKLTNQFYQGNVASPAYSQAQGAIAQGANQASNQVAANLGARGIGTSGTAAVLSGLTPSLIGSQQAGLRTSAYNQGAQQAQDAIKQQLEALQATYNQPSPSQQLFGVGLQSFAPFLQAYFAKQYPNFFNFGNTQTATK